MFQELNTLLMWRIGIKIADSSDNFLIVVTSMSHIWENGIFKNLLSVQMRYAENFCCWTYGIGNLFMVSIHANNSLFHPKIKQVMCKTVSVFAVECLCFFMFIIKNCTNFFIENFNLWFFHVIPWINKHITKQNIYLVNQRCYDMIAVW